MSKDESKPKPLPTTKLIPQHDRVIAYRDEEEKTSAGGIVLPGNAQVKKSSGIVIAAGKGKHYDGEFRPNHIKKGMRVYFHTYAGGEISLGDGLFGVVLSQEDILAYEEL